MAALTERNIKILAIGGGLVLVGLAVAAIVKKMKLNFDLTGLFAFDNQTTETVQEELPDYEKEVMKVENTKQTIKPKDQEAANLQAFLALIRHTETGYDDNTAYKVLMGSTKSNPRFLSSFNDHPAKLGWKGQPLSATMCRNAGLGPGCVSTAAGAYQIIKSTWDWVKKKGGLPDFSPSSQDKAAVLLIDYRKALADVKAGRFTAAIQKVSIEWASLPGNNYKQNPKSLAAVKSIYQQHGGIIVS